MNFITPHLRLELWLKVSDHHYLTFVIFDFLENYQNLPFESLLPLSPFPMNRCCV